MLNVEWLGRTEYDDAWELQKELVAQREQNPELDDKLLLLEHPPTYTLGRHGHLENLLLDQEILEERGFALHRVDRGGDITYHGPGQLVGYPILNLKRIYGAGIGRIRRYVTDIESILIETLAAFSIEGQRFENHRGVWLSTDAGMKKVAAIGIHVTAKGISSHGFALNVDPDLAHYSSIVPCGIQNYGVTSMAEISETPVQMLEVIPHIVSAFKDVLSLEIAFEGTKYASH
jgi:lipoate-protein ligase B